MKIRLLLAPLLGFIFILLYLSLEVVASVGLPTHALRADYLVFLTGGTMFSQGHYAASELYNIAIQSNVQQHLLSGSGISFIDGLLPFVHPPYVAFISAPLASLSPTFGFVVWDMGQLLALCLSLYLLRPMLPPRYRYLLWLGAFAFFPVYQSLLEGQISPAFLLSIVLFWRCLRLNGRADWGAGVSLALGLTKPHLLILFVLYLLYKRNWRALGGFAISGLTLYLLTSTFAGLDWPFVYLSTLNWLNAQTNHYGMLPQVMANWHGLLVRASLDNSLLLGAIIGVTITILIYAWWRGDWQAAWGSINPISTIGDDVGTQFITPHTGRVGTLELQLAATTIATALTSLYLYTHDLTMLVFSGAVMLGWVAEQRSSIWLRVILGANLIAPMVFYYGVFIDGFVLVMALTFAALLLLLIQYRPVSVPLAEGLR